MFAFGQGEAVDAPLVPAIFPIFFESNPPMRIHQMPPPSKHFSPVWLRLNMVVRAMRSSHPSTRLPPYHPDLHTIFGAFIRSFFLLP